MTDNDNLPPEPSTQRLQNVGAHSAFEGADLDERHLTRDEQATVDALVAGTALLIVLRGPNSGARFLLDNTEVTAGRGSDSDIFLDDVTVSRRHAVFSQEGGFTVRDVGSLNGTYVNRERIDSAPLKTGDEVQIGKFRLVFYAAHP